MDLPRGLGNQHITYFGVNVDKHLNRKRNLKVFDAMIIIFSIIKVILIVIFRICILSRSPPLPLNFRSWKVFQNLCCK